MPQTHQFLEVSAFFRKFAALAELSAGLVSTIDRGFVFVSRLFPIEILIRIFDEKIQLNASLYFE